MLQDRTTFFTATTHITPPPRRMCGMFFWSESGVGGVYGKVLQFWSFVFCGVVTCVGLARDNNSTKGLFSSERRT